MRRIKTVLGVVAVMAAMLVVFAAPAMADDWDWIDQRDDFYWYDDVGFLGYGATSYDELCSPGLPEGIYVPGCIFSDPIKHDDFVFVNKHDWDWDDHDDHDDWGRKDWDHDWGRKDWDDHDRDDHHDWEGPVHFID